MASTRSGKQYIAYNKPFFSSKKELLSHHSRLTSKNPTVETRTFRVGNGKAHLIETTARFHSSAEPKLIHQVLKKTFFQLKVEGAASTPNVGEPEAAAVVGGGDGKWNFEVNVTFNAILHNSDIDSWSVFYGLDYAKDNPTGVSKSMTYGDTVVIDTEKDILKIPTSFDMNHVLKQCRQGFTDSSVYVDSLLNVVYLIYKFRQ